MKYAVLTFGCRVNQAESFGFDGELRGCGAEPSPAEVADLVLVNTCTVTAAADQRARRAIRHIARVNPSARIVVTGCYATRRPTDLQQLAGVTRLVRNAEKGRLLASIGADFGLTASGPCGDGKNGYGFLAHPGDYGRTAHFLRVQTGCDEQCAYCVIPSTRGPSRSRPLARILAEADRATDAGYQEVVLTGVHLGSYGRDLVPRQSLVDLLRALDGRGRDVLYRISAIEPMDLTPAVIDVVVESGRFAPHVHLPLQHASDRMLRAMRRHYSLDDYRRLVATIRHRLPDAAIGTDLIVGFPGETDSDFGTSMDFLGDSPLTSVHVFPYSDRPGTAAADMQPKVPGAAVRARAEALRQRASELSRRFRRSQVGRVRRGLTIEDGSLVLTDNYLKVRVPPGHRRNECVQVRILAAAETLRGTVVDGRR